MRKLPIGIQHFAHLRERGYIYVDKTRLIYDLITAGEFVFLSRPRRFGKSLLASTLKELFAGNRTLFQGLWIEDKIDWQPHPVILINFNALSYIDQSLAVALTKYMDDLAAEHNLTLQSNHYKEKFRELLALLGERGKVVLLVDEYDKAITDLLENDEKVREHVATLKDFYSVLKAPEAEHLHFTLLTGVSKYGKISLFSDLNNLLDVTLDTRFATLLGYTQTELESYFSVEIDQLAARFQADRAAVLAQVKFWYNGYSWDGVNRVYVPFSTLVFFTLLTFANHWFATATPSFLIKLLRREQIPAYALEEAGGDNKLLDSADVDNIDVVSLLFQTGYLTIRRVERTLQGDYYELGYPNYEVAQSFRQYLLADYLVGGITQVNNIWLLNLRKSLQTQNVAGFINVLQSIFASIPHTLFLPQEAYYHSVVYLVLQLLGFEVHVERLTNLGRIDALLTLDKTVYIIEFKMTASADAKAAVQQIRTKAYDQPYRNQGKQIILLGIAFDQTQRNIVDWVVEMGESGPGEH